MKLFIEDIVLSRVNGSLNPIGLLLEITTIRSVANFYTGTKQE